MKGFFVTGLAVLAAVALVAAATSKVVSGAIEVNSSPQAK